MSNSRPVYSSEHGKLCPECGRSLALCHCKALQKARPGDGVAKVRRETKGRKGKGMTTITDLPLNDSELKELASTLKRKLSTGGSLKDGVIEIQGDHVDRLIAELKSLGYKAKRSGG